MLLQFIGSSRTSYKLKYPAIIFGIKIKFSYSNLTRNNSMHARAFVAIARTPGQPGQIRVPWNWRSVSQGDDGAERRPMYADTKSDPAAAPGQAAKCLPGGASALQ